LIYGCYDPLMSRGVYTACPAFNRLYRELLRKDRVLMRLLRSRPWPGMVWKMVRSPAMAFAIKAEIDDFRAKTFAFTAQKTMYGGKHVAEGDEIFLFASENEGGTGLIARGVVTSAAAVARKRGVERQTPRVNLTVKRTALAKRQLGRKELKPFSDWKDGRSETELNFKFYRQATDKLVGISDEAAEFLRTFF
jgi:hypothetical protein